jgi:hypothetical protein
MSSTKVVLVLITLIPHLSSLASEGAIIDTEPNFIKIFPHDTTRPIVSQLPNTIFLHAQKLWNKGKAIILDITLLNRHNLFKLFF